MNVTRRSVQTLLFLSATVCVSLNAATIYYVDAEKGDDANAGTGPENAWKTLTKVNASQKQLKPGDSVLLHAAQAFAGPLMPASGSEESPITYGRYGEGNNPEITGFTVPTEWKNIQPGIWEAPCPLAPKAANMVTIDGIAYAMGRFPNADAPNGGYLAVKSHVKNTSLTDAELPETQDWTGGEAVVRKVRWVIDRNKITSHKEHTLTFTPASAYEVVNGHGYFIENHPKTLDVFGEWYFHPEEKTLRVFTGDKDPSKLSIKMTAVDRLITASDRQNILFDGLKLSGANQVALFLSGSSGISVKHCEFRSSGDSAIQGFTVKKFTIEDSSIEDTFNNAMAFQTGLSNGVIRNVTIKNTGIFAGMGHSGDGSYNAIMMMTGNDNLIENFNIINTGYIPVQFGGSHVTVRNGFIDRFAFIKDDSGGIYTWTGAADRTPHTDRKVTGNIILNSRGAIDGAVGEAKGFGIYLDDAAANVEVTGNTVAHTSAGIFLHNAHHSQISKNMFFDNDIQMLITHDGIEASAHAEIREVLNSENTLISTSRLQHIINANTMTDDFKKFGTFEKNIHARPADQNILYVFTIKDTLPRAFDIEGLREVTGLEKTTQPARIKLKPYKINNLGPNIVANGEFTKNVSEASPWTPNGSGILKWAEDKLDGGALQYTYKNASGKPNASLLIVNAGALSANKYYLLKFSIQGTVANGSAGVRLRRVVKPWDGLTDHQFIEIDTTRRECELLFKSTSDQSNSSIEWSFDERDGNFLLDNVSLCQADATELDPNIFRFEYNLLNEPKTLDLEGEWVDVTGASYTGKLTIPPRGSIVILKKADCEILKR